MEYKEVAPKAPANVPIASVPLDKEHKKGVESTAADTKSTIAKHERQCVGLKDTDMSKSYFKVICWSLAEFDKRVDYFKKAPLGPSKFVIAFLQKDNRISWTCSQPGGLWFDDYKDRTVCSDFTLAAGQDYKLQIKDFHFDSSPLSEAHTDSSDVAQSMDWLLLCRDISVKDNVLETARDGHYAIRYLKVTKKASESQVSCENFGCWRLPAKLFEHITGKCQVQCPQKGSMKYDIQKLRFYSQHQLLLLFGMVYLIDGESRSEHAFVVEIDWTQATKDHIREWGDNELLMTSRSKEPEFKVKFLQIGDYKPVRLFGNSGKRTPESIEAPEAPFHPTRMFLCENPEANNENGQIMFALGWSNHQALYLGRHQKESKGMNFEDKSDMLRKYVVEKTKGSWADGLNCMSWSANVKNQEGNLAIGIKHDKILHLCVED